MFPIVFISDANEDEPVAAALQSLISRVFRAGATETVLVKYLSDSAAGDGTSRYSCGAVPGLCTVISHSSAT